MVFDAMSMTFMVTFPSGNAVFKQESSWLFYYDTTASGALTFAQIFGRGDDKDYDGHAVTTTKHTIKGLSKQNTATAWAAHKLQAMPSHPSYTDFGIMFQFHQELPHHHSRH